MTTKILKIIFSAFFFIFTIYPALPSYTPVETSSPVEIDKIHLDTPSITATSPTERSPDPSNTESTLHILTDPTSSTTPSPADSSLNGYEQLCAALNSPSVRSGAKLKMKREHKKRLEATNTPGELSQDVINYITQACRCAVDIAWEERNWKNKGIDKAALESAFTKEQIALARAIATQTNFLVVNLEERAASTAMQKFLQNNKKLTKKNQQIYLRYLYDELIASELISPDVTWKEFIANVERYSNQKNEPTQCNCQCAIL